MLAKDPGQMRTLLVLAFMGVLGPGAVAAAQGTLTVNLTKIGSKDYNTVEMRPVNAEECGASGLILEFEVLGLGAAVTAGKENLEVWWGENCNDTNRTDETASDCEPLYNEEINGQSELTVFFPLQGLPCENFAGARPLYFLAMDSPGSMEIVEHYGFFDLPIDTNPPEAPRKVEGGSGESKIPIDWDSDDTDVDKFIVYWESTDGSTDDMDGGPGDCSPGELRAGGDSESLSGDVRSKTVSQSGASGTSLDGDDIDGEVAAVAVVAVDDAGNRSPLSEVVCVRVVPTDGFWDSYQAMGGQVEPGCACSAPGSRASGAASALPILAVLCALARRRRRA